MSYVTPGLYVVSIMPWKPSSRSLLVTYDTLSVRAWLLVSPLPDELFKLLFNSLQLLY